MAMRYTVECRCAIATAVTVTVTVAAAAAANAHTSLDDSRNVSASYTDRKQHETDTIFCEFRLYIG